MCTNYQNVYEFAQKSWEKKKETEILEPSLKPSYWEEETKTGNELLSGKKESTTASRSPNSDVEKKEHEELTKSGIWDIELSKNPNDIRSYFIVSEDSKPPQKQPDREHGSGEILNTEESQVMISTTKSDKKKWSNEIQKNCITSYFT